MKDKLFEFLEKHAPGCRPIYIVRRGSYMHGSDIESSDEDYTGVYIQDMDSIFSINGYRPNVNDAKSDMQFYELSKFLELLLKSSPNQLDLLFVDNDCIVYKDPIFDDILVNSKSFISKKFFSSIIGQIDSYYNQNGDKNKILSNIIILHDKALDILDGKGYITRRPNSDFLKSIRRGEVGNVDELLSEYISNVSYIKDKLSKSDIKESVSVNLVNQLLINIRKKSYGIINY